MGRLQGLGFGCLGLRASRNPACRDLGSCAGIAWNSGGFENSGPTVNPKSPLHQRSTVTSLPYFFGENGFAALQERTPPVLSNVAPLLGITWFFNTVTCHGYETGQPREATTLVSKR